MRRREFITLIGGVVGAWSITTQAQQSMPVMTRRAQVREASRARIAYQWGDLALTAQ